jgi:integrase
MRALGKRAHTPAAAKNYVRMVRLLMRFAIERGWREDDPTAAVKTTRKKSDGFRSWTDADIAKFEERWPEGTRAHLALSLLLFTGQRRSDVVRMGRQHISGKLIHIQQKKTKERLTIPLHRKLSAALERVDIAGQLTFLMTQQGKPFTPAGFTNWFVDCAKTAGLPQGSTPHGLRKAAARRLAEAGCTPHQIMSITGHKSLKEVNHYTLAVNQVALAEEAINAIS